MLDKRQEGDVQQPAKDAGHSQIAAAQYNPGDHQSRTALLDQARSGFTRGGVSDSLDFSSFSNPYGGSGTAGSDLGGSATAGSVLEQAGGQRGTGLDLTSAYNQALSDRGVVPFAGTDLSKPLGQSDTVASLAGADTPAGGAIAVPNLDSDVYRKAVGLPPLEQPQTAPTDRQTTPPPTTPESKPAEVEVKRGDSLWKIARHELGSKASNADVMNYVRDMAKANGMPDPFKPENHRATIIHPGQHLKLPGAQGDAPQSPTPANNPGDSHNVPLPPPRPSDIPSQTTPPQVEARPAARITPRLEPSPQTNPTDASTPVKKPVDGGPETPEVQTNPAATGTQGFDAAKQKLQADIAASSIPAVEKQRLLDNMATFEKRAATDQVSPDEVQKTYQAVDRLLTSKGDQPISQTQKDVLASEIMIHAAKPTDIDQGHHETCGPTSMEVRMFMKHPSIAANVIADVGTTGQYTAKDGHTVKLTQNDLQPDTEAQTYPPAERQRTYASQLFQTTAIDLGLQKWHDRQVQAYSDALKAGNSPEDLKQPPAPDPYRYYEAPTQPGNKRTAGLPNHEELVNSRGPKKDGFSGLTAGALSDVETAMTGTPDPEHYLANHQAYTFTEFNKGRITTFDNAQQFADALKQAKADGNLPLTLYVNTDKPPFRRESGVDAGGRAGGHFVTVTGYDENTGKVKIDNQWGKQDDHIKDGGIDISQLYKATLPLGHFEDGPIPPPPPTDHPHYNFFMKGYETEAERARRRQRYEMMQTSD